MSRPADELPIIHLKAGEMRCSNHPMLVVTVLGSCLSVVMYSRRLGIGGICHGKLPSCSRQEPCSDQCSERFTYVDCSIRQMVKLFEQFGCRRSEMEVKYFGGADMFLRPVERPGLMSVGRKNSVVAQETIRSEGLTLTTRDVGGRQGRKVLFYPHTGEVLVKRLTKAGAIGAADLILPHPERIARMSRGEA